MLVCTQRFAALSATQSCPKVRGARRAARDEVVLHTNREKAETPMKKSFATLFAAATIALTPLAVAPSAPTQATGPVATLQASPDDFIWCILHPRQCLASVVD